MIENIRQDYIRNREYFGRTKQKPGMVRILFRAFQDSGFRAVLFYRMGRWCRDRNLRLTAVFIERLMRHMSHCWISTLSDIGPGLIIAHGCGIVIPPGVILGKNCDVRQNITIGGNYGKRSEDGRTNPVIGDNVSIGAGAAVLGPIKIGSNSIIGANAVVTKSVPENSVVGAFRAEVLAERGPDGSIIRGDKHVFLSRKALYDRIEALEEKVKSLEIITRRNDP